MQEWEYKIIQYGDFTCDLDADERPDQLEKLLNKAGAEGYRLVPIYLGSYGCVAVMEREKIKPFTRV